MFFLSFFFIVAFPKKKYKNTKNIKQNPHSNISNKNTPPTQMDMKTMGSFYYENFVSIYFIFSIILVYNHIFSFLYLKSF